MSRSSEILFKRADLILTIVAVVAIGASTFYSLKSFKSRRNRAECEGRLWGLGKAFYEYSTAHEGGLPMSISTNQGGTKEFGASGTNTFQHFNALVPYLPGPGFLVCPLDRRVPLGGTNHTVESLRKGWRLGDNSNLSYFVNLDAKLGSTNLLAGDRNLGPAGSILPLTASQKLRWIPEMGLHQTNGYVAFTDGHVELLDFMQLNAAISGLKQSTQYLSLP
jgi:prepilin-type processing-associated H-X9-DG protein